MTTEKTLPHNLDAERSVLGAVIIHNEALHALTALRPEHFYRKGHELLFRAMLDLDAKGSPIDFRLLHAELVRTGMLDEVGGPAYIASLADGMPRSTNVAYYGEVVLEHALRRALIFESNRVLDLAYSAELPAREVVSQAETRLLELDRRSDGATDARSAGEMAAELSPMLAELWENGGRRGLRSGLAGLDELTGGFKPGELVVIGARPSMGKTALALQLAMEGAQMAPVLFLSLEMSRAEVGIRGVSAVSGYGSRVITGDITLPQHVRSKILASMEEWSRLDLHVDDAAGLSVAQVRSKARRFKARQKGIGLLVIDYLQLLRGDRAAKYENRNLELGEMSRTLKEIAKDLGIPVVILSQLNRNLEQRSEKRPGLSDLRESGAIEQDADVVLLLHRPHYYDQSQDPSYAEIIIAKQRNGPTGTVPVTWRAEVTLFETRQQPPRAA